MKLKRLNRGDDEFESTLTMLINEKRDSKVPFGLPKCDKIINLLPTNLRALIVSRDFLNRKSFTILPFSIGTFRSSRSITVLFFIDSKSTRLGILV